MTIKTVILITTFTWGGHLMGAESDKVRILEVTQEDEKIIVLENSYYRAILVPEKAMLPLRFFCKATSHEVLVWRDDLKKSFASQDGIMDCFPWVDGVPAKGLLRTVPWQKTLKEQGGQPPFKVMGDVEPWRKTLKEQSDQASFIGTATVEYPDPVSGQIALVTVTKTITGYSHSPQLKMDYELVNTGKHPAKFILVAHARLAAGGTYDDGDYVYAPGTNCWVGDFKWPGLEQKGIKPYSWMDWPAADIMNFKELKPAEKKGHYVYVFVPASWAAVGNTLTREFILFQSSPITIGATVQKTPFFCILHRDNDYLLEAGVTRALNVKQWAEPWATATLNPGEKLSWTLSMTAAQGLDQQGVMNITQVLADRLLLKSEGAGSEKIFFLAP